MSPHELGAQPGPGADTILPYLDHEPSVVTVALGVLAVVAVVAYVAQVLRMPKGTFWKRHFRTEPFVNPRLGIGSMVAMVGLVGLVLLAGARDRAAHDARVDAQEEEQDAIQAELRAELEAYYGVELTDEYRTIRSSADSVDDDLPGDQVRVRLPDGTERDDCYVGEQDGSYVLSCGPEGAAEALPPAGVDP